MFTKMITAFVELQMNSRVKTDLQRKQIAHNALPARTEAHKLEIESCLIYF